MGQDEMKTVARRATRNDPGDGGWAGTVLMEGRGPIAGVRASCLVFVREHHCEDAGRDRGIGRIRRHQVHICVVVIDLPEAPDIAVLDETEIVFTVRIVVLVELIERPDLAKYQAALFCW
jgi:hypothetical protein